jgi:amino acid adenylation domain-containing protein
MRPEPIVLPLSEAQSEVWLATQQGENASRAFNQVFCLRLRGSLQLEPLRQSLNTLVARHDALRTTFLPDGSGQRIAPTGALDLTVTDISGENLSERDRRLAEITRAEDATVFDLVNGPLVRARLVKLSPQEHVLIVATHHLVMDGWSITVFCRELSQFYNTFVRGEKPSLKPAAQLRDYLQWQTENRAASAQAEAYWLQQYANPPTPVELPGDRLRSATPSFRAACESLTLKPALHRALKETAAQNGVTLFTMLFASLNVLFSRLSGNDDVALGVPAAGQLALGTDEGKLLIGHCVNFLPLRCRCEGALSSAEHLQSIKRVMLDAYEHQQFTYGNLVQKLKLPRDSSRPPLLCATFNVMRAQTDIHFDGLESEISLAPKGFNLFDVGVDVLDAENELRLDCRFNSDLFEPATFRRWLAHWQTLLEAAVRLPESPIAKLPMLDDAERKKIVMEWNDTHRNFPPVQSMIELFEKQAAENPDATALVFKDQRLNYRELNERADRLARHLRQLGVRSEMLVGICTERCPEMIIGLLGILKAGGAYVPLDPHYPAERLAFILEDTKATVLLTQQELAPVLPPHHAQIIFLDAPIPESNAELPSDIQPDQLAYIIYTSGSTGRPKGVTIEHRNALALIHWAREVFTDEELSGVLASTSICFDLSVFEIFVTLSCGGKIVLADNALELPRLPAAREVTLINSVPSAAAELVRQDAIPATVTTVNLAGEPLKRALVQQLYQRLHIRKVYDLYGPSEDTTYSTWTLRRAHGPETIGRPMSNKQVYLLDAQLQPVPVGVTGELYIGGAGVARGYLNRPELTAEKFIPDPFSPLPDARLYKTGDLARYLADGNIQFLGRIDHQVKVRGFRIELGEIESVLRRHENLRDVLVMARANDDGEKRIVAYVVAHHEPAPTPRELKDHVASQLPEYMVPSAFVLMDALPLTPNGKVDRKALPEPEAQTESSEFVAPTTPAELAIAKMWCEVLGVKQVGLHDNFFSLGGHSLMATQLISRFSKFHQVQVKLRDIFDAPTVAEMSKWLEKKLV